MYGFTDFSVELHAGVPVPTHVPCWSSCELRSLQELKLELGERVGEIRYKNKHRQAREQEWGRQGQDDAETCIRRRQGGRERSQSPGAGVLG